MAVAVVQMTDDDIDERNEDYDVKNDDYDVHHNECRGKVSTIKCSSYNVQQKHHCALLTCYF